MADFEWRETIIAAQDLVEPDTQATRWVRKAGAGGSEPQVWECSDGHEYHVKHSNTPQGGRVLVADHVFGTLAQRVEAPCPAVRLVEVPAALIDAGDLHFNDGTTKLASGIQHGSCSITTSCQDQPPPPAAQKAPENRDRLARLTVMYTWFVPGDPQWVVETAAPNLVYSVDHGYYLPGQNAWNAGTLAGQPDIAVPNFPPEAGLKDEDMRNAFAPAKGLQEPEVAAAVALADPSWGADIDDLEALAKWLWSRYGQLAAKWG